VAGAPSAGALRDRHGSATLRPRGGLPGVPVRLLGHAAAGRRLHLSGVDCPSRPGATWVQLVLGVANWPVKAVIPPCAQPKSPRPFDRLGGLPYRRARIERTDAEAEALIHEFCAEAYSKALRREREASSDENAKDWSRVALAIADKLRRRVGIDPSTTSGLTTQRQFALRCCGDNRGGRGSRPPPSVTACQPASASKFCSLS